MRLAAGEAWGQRPALLTRLSWYPESGSAGGEREGGLLGTASLSGAPFPWGAVLSVCLASQSQQRD